MDLLPFQDVYDGLFVEAATHFLSRVWTFARVRIEAGSNLDKAIERAATRTAEVLLDLASVPAISDHLGGERYRAFLMSREAADICGLLIFAHATHADSLENDLLSRFRATASWYTNRPETDLAPHVDRVFAALSHAAREILAGADPVASVFDAGSPSVDRRMRLSRDESHKDLASLLRLFSHRRVPDFAAVAQFETELREAVEERHRRIEPPNYDEPSLIHLYDLYVAPRFAEAPDLDPDDNVTDMPAHLNRAVILGHPGAGKSTYASARCYDSATGGTVTRILLPLRDYAAAKATTGVSVVEYLEDVVRGRYQTPAPPLAVEYLLRSGRLGVVFDGLDELTVTNQRREIRTDIDIFASRYTSAQILVTSRIIGYPEAPLADDRFRVVYIQPFDTARVRDYSERWFRRISSLHPTERAARAAAFVAESEVVPDLRAIPLLLALMCSIYRRKNYLPRNRPDVYAECAEMLFDRWDRSRQVFVDRPIESHLMPVLQHVASWLFISPDHNAGVTEDALVAHIAAYVLIELTDDEQRANAVAREFFSFCRGRGWVIAAVGLDADDRELYRFVHQTFLEYFTAGWFAASDNSPDELARLLLPHVEIGEWDAVASLAVQIRARGVRGAGNEFIALTLDRLKRKRRTSEARGRLLYFTARLTQAFSPRPETTRALVTAAVNEELGFARASVDGLERRRGEIIRALLSADEEVARLVVERAGEVLTHAIMSDAKEDAVLAVDAALTLTHGLPTHLGYVAERWEQIGREVFRDCHERIGELARTSRTAGRVLCEAGLISVYDVAAALGPGPFLTRTEHPFAKELVVQPMLEQLLAAGTHDGPAEDPDLEPMLMELGAALRTKEPPWHVEGRPWIPKERDLKWQIPLSDLPSSALLAVGILIIGTILLLPDGLSQSTHSAILRCSRGTPLAMMIAPGIKVIRPQALTEEDWNYFKKVRSTVAFVGPSASGQVSFERASLW